MSHAASWMRPNSLVGLDEAVAIRHRHQRFLAGQRQQVHVLEVGKGRAVVLEDIDPAAATIRRRRPRSKRPAPVPAPAMVPSQSRPSTTAVASCSDKIDLPTLPSPLSSVTFAGGNAVLHRPLSLRRWLILPAAMLMKGSD